LKPHAQVLKEFAATRPTIRPIPAFARLPVNPDAFYDTAVAPSAHLPALYQAYLSQK
jgi:hypothetical protein